MIGQFGTLIQKEISLSNKLISERCRFVIKSLVKMLLHRHQSLRQLRVMNSNGSRYGS
jgi:hypothetical protein